MIKKNAIIFSIIFFSFPFVALADQVATSSSDTPTFDNEIGRFSPVRGEVIRGSNYADWCINSAEFYIWKNGSPGSNLTAHIAASTSTYAGTSGLQNGWASTSLIVGSSQTKTPSDFGASAATTTFIFSPCVDVSHLDGFIIYIEASSLNSTNYYFTKQSTVSHSPPRHSRFNNATTAYQDQSGEIFFQIFIPDPEPPSAGNNIIIKKYSNAGFAVGLGIALIAAISFSIFLDIIKKND